jgi:hypothetical protein
MFIPVVGHVVVLDYLPTVLIAAVEGAVVVGGLSALGAALYSSGIPKSSVLAYDTAIITDVFLVTARGPAGELARARTILGTFNPSQTDLHDSIALAA